MTSPLLIPDLKPCPFCGSADIAICPDEIGSGGQWVFPIHVCCNVQTGCGIPSASGEDIEEATARWNTRAYYCHASEVVRLRVAIGRALDELNTPGHLGGTEAVGGTNMIAHRLRRALSAPPTEGIL